MTYSVKCSVTNVSMTLRSYVFKSINFRDLNFHVNSNISFDDAIYFFSDVNEHNAMILCIQ